MKKWITVSLCMILSALTMAGCSDKTSFEQASKSDQDKAWKGDPVKQKEMEAKMRAKYVNSGPPPGAVPAGVQAPAGNNGKP